jgi:hypothetical protein
MYYIKIIVVVLTTVLSVALPVLAQTDSELLQGQILESDLGETIIAGNNVLTVRLARDLQDPGSKDIYYRFLITSASNSDRVELEWAIQGVSQSPTARKKTLTLKAGQTTTESFQVLPRAFGKTEVRVEVRMFDAGQNYVAAARDQFVTNKELDIIPITSEYQNAKNLNMAKNIGLALAGIVIAFFTVRFIIKKVQQRLATEQKEKSFF